MTGEGVEDGETDGRGPPPCLIVISNPLTSTPAWRGPHLPHQPHPGALLPESTLEATEEGIDMGRDRKWLEPTDMHKGVSRK
ncbi:unnamed protein product [Gadus morhua 'NCC']